MNGQTRIAFVATLTLLLLMPADVNAWSAGGHRIIAYRHLSDASRERVIAILKQHPRLPNEFQNPAGLRLEDRAAWMFTQAGVWPDLIRKKKPWDHPTWHYINQPHFLSDADERALRKRLNVNLSRDLPVNGDYSELNALQAIKLCKQKLADTTVKDKKKAVYLCWLIHLVGDIHQPCHSIALFSQRRFHYGDRDANRIPIAMKRSKNLHSFWDGLLGGNIKHGQVVRRSASIILDRKLRKAGEEASKKLDLEDWGKESVTLAKEVVYSPTIIEEVKAKEGDLDADLKKVSLPESDRRSAGKVAQKRGVEASFRLVVVLEELLKKR